jgi:hypothetical protein
MTFDAETLAKLVVVDMPAESLREVLKILSEAKKGRSANAARQARWRERHGGEGVTNNVTRNVTRNVTNPSPEVPPKDNSNPLPTPIPCVSDETLVDGQAADVELPLTLPKIDRSKKTETLRLLGETWNAFAGECGLPSIEEIRPGSKRERAALNLATVLRNNFPDIETGFTDLMCRIRGSPYLRGQVNGFSCTFDWIANTDNYDKIMGGSYEARKQTAVGRR